MKKIDSSKKRFSLRRTRTVTLAVATSALVLAACGSTSSSQGTSSQGSSQPAGSATSGNITWWASPIAQVGIRANLISHFEKAYPKIHVTLESAPTNTDTNRSQLVTEISGGSTTPDVFMGDVIWPAQFGAHSLAVPLSKYLPSSYFAKFAPGLVSGASYKGQVYGSPLFEDQGFLYYRKDLLAKAHLPVPKTWQQLESESLTLEKDGYVKYGFVWEGDSYEGLTCDFMEYLTSAGGKVVNSGYTKAELDSPQAIKAVSFMRSLITSGASPQAVTTFQEPQAMAVFDAGNAAFLRNWDYAWANSQTPANSKVVGDVGVAPLPTFAGQSYPGYSNIGGWNLYINPHSKNIAADLTFIKWMSSTEAQMILGKTYSEIPTVESVRQELASSSSTPPPLKVAAETNLVPRPAGTPNYPQLSNAIYTNVNAALSGSMSVSAALKAAQSQAQTALSGGL
ncbi:carbohydrate ABC transporter substrate-binding protein, CUT1 family [Ferrithrix thermotolerans DSM 19514]|uniref:Carbohydrate ABC transporter substrate-binding protein, CUT1 family n=1 Tax=Ferrithrix thermotolerans DSM 19514 TaxID=1121881 RepID=A0A1M4UZT2_9ACTN|nr:ABC transporter substrate-binding protein [Ferrithrix thermotolerans]SHE62261.1 carbohydrate ABC transporter substrate-binding protein, CUT1 family [Ferrithrix thermotolerans DSM 19514]